jgi:outer membrane protein assembly factor BamB
MSVERFITELEQRDLLTDRQLAKLRDAAAEKQMTAKTLAKFLVQKNLLSQQQATDLLTTVQLGGGDLDATSRPPEEPAPVQIGISDESIPDLDDDPESSSIFASYLTRPEVRTSQISSTEAEEFMLVPELEEAEPEEAPRRVERAAPRVEEVDLIPEEKPAGLKQLASVERARPKVSTKSKRPGSSGEGKSKKAPSLKKKKAWDSPLILLGGGGLLLMLMTGGLVWWLMIRESADQKLTLARAAMDQGAYTKAIEHYEDFIVSAPRHPEHDVAQVQVVLLRVRQPTESGDFEEALSRAETELKKIEDNKKFEEAHGELAALLPQIAMGLAQQTEKAEPGSPDAAKSAELANKALELCSNVTYIPKTLRDEAKLTAVRDTLQLVERRNQTKAALDATLQQMQEGLAASDTTKSYKAYRDLLQTHRDLSDNSALADLLTKTTAAEQAAIRYTKEAKAAKTQERGTPWVASLAIADRPLKPATGSAVAVPGTSAVACVRIDGAIYAFDVTTGKLLWRRFVGAGASWPQLIDQDVLIADTRHQELLRLNSRTGGLVWRQEIGERFAAPLIAGSRLLIAAASGRLYAIDAKSGHREGFVLFAQTLRVAPTVNRSNGCIYLAGDHSTLFALSGADLSCLGVFYLGHSEGSIATSPVATMDKLALVENDGATTSRLRLLSTSDNGAIAAKVGERRLSGLPCAPPIVAGRRLIAITDRGQIEVYDVGGQGEQALAPVASRVATGTSPVVRYVQLADRNIWVGDARLTKFAILPTGNRLPVEAIENDFTGSEFDHPLQLFGNTLVHVRRAKGRSGAVVSATATAQGNTLWETAVATPPSGAPVVDEAAKAITVANAEGALFRFDESAIRSRIQDEPLAAQAAPNPLPALQFSADLGQGRVVFGAVGSDQILLYNPSLNPAARWIKLDSALASEIASLGQGLVAPLSIGQVFLLSAMDGSKLTAPFQTLLQPDKEWRFSSAGVVDANSNQFVISDGEGKIYLIGMEQQPKTHLRELAKADSGPQPIESRPVVLDGNVLAVAGSSQLVRFQLPALQPLGEANLPAPAVWGPYVVGDVAVLATANNELMAITANGKVKWHVPCEHGDLAGAPLPAQDGMLIAYRQGILEKRSLADGKPVSTVDVEQPLAAGPVTFMQRLLLVANDGTLLVVDQP